MAFLACAVKNRGGEKCARLVAVNRYDFPLQYFNTEELYTLHSVLTQTVGVDKTSAVELMSAFVHA